MFARLLAVVHRAGHDNCVPAGRGADAGSRHWPAHYELNPEAQLAEEADSGAEPCARRFARWFDERKLVQKRGKGTFVTARAADLTLAPRLVSKHEILAATGHEDSTRVLGHEVGLGPERVGSRLDVNAGEPPAGPSAADGRLRHTLAVERICNHWRFG